MPAEPLGSRHSRYTVQNFRMIYIVVVKNFAQPFFCMQLQIRLCISLAQLERVSPPSLVEAHQPHCQPDYDAPADYGVECAGTVTVVARGTAPAVQVREAVRALASANVYGLAAGITKYGHDNLSVY